MGKKSLHKVLAELEKSYSDSAVRMAAKEFVRHHTGKNI